MDKNLDQGLKEMLVSIGVIAESGPFDEDFDPFDVDEGDSSENEETSDILDYDPFLEENTDSIDDSDWEESLYEAQETYWINKHAIDNAFHGVKGHGFDAHAYKHSLDNEKILTLWGKKYSLRKIAKQLNCSPNTIKNRLIKMGYI